MATINFYDDMLGEVSFTKEYDMVMIKNAINEYLENKEYEDEIVEVYDVDTGKTTYEKMTTEGFKVVVIVNGMERNPSFVISKDDVCSVMFIPQGQKYNNVMETAFGVGNLLLGTALVLGGAPWAGLLFMGIGSALVYDVMKNQDATTSGDNIEHKSLPYIDGSENESQVGQPYLYTMGKHLLVPRLVGSPYHETHVSNIKKAKDNGQYYHLLYCAGFGPLKLTDLKLGDTYVARNRPYGDSIKQTVLHGQLSGDDITSTWKDNDVKIEIIQAGGLLDYFGQNGYDVNQNKYGSIYPQSVAEQTVDSPVLFVYDKDLNHEELISYKNKTIVSGYRTNTVKFSASCPHKIQVELDMPGGYFETYQKTTSSSQEVRYKSMPINIAVQWRFRKPGMQSSNSNSAEGWTSFSSMIFDEGNIATIKYDADKRELEISENRGLSKGTSKNYNNGWLEKKCFSLAGEKTVQWLALYEPYDNQIGLGGVYDNKNHDQGWVSPLLDEYVNRGYLEEHKWKLLNHPKGMKKSYCRCKNSLHWDPKYYTTTSSCPDTIKIINYIPYYKSSMDYNSESVKKTEFNIDERRYVFEYNFTEEECRKLAGINSDINDAVEVRVIRLSPCYLDEATSESDKESAHTYEDLVNWKFLRTWKFDKTKYTEALKNEKILYSSDGDTFYDDASKTIVHTFESIEEKDKYYNLSGEKYSNVSVSYYPERPVPLAEDSDNFCFIALHIKQDVIEAAGRSLKKLSCISQSFGPKYDVVKKKWTPESSVKCFRKDDSPKGVYYSNEDCTDIIIQPRKEAWTYDGETFYSRVPAVAQGQIATGSNVYRVQPVGTITYTGVTRIGGILRGTGIYKQVYYEKNADKSPKFIDVYNDVNLYQFDGVSSIYKYIHKHISDDGKVTIDDTLTKEEYLEHAGKNTETDLYYKQNNGNDFISNLKNEVFTNFNYVENNTIKLVSADNLHFYGVEEHRSSNVPLCYSLYDFELNKTLYKVEEVMETSGDETHQKEEEFGMYSKDGENYYSIVFNGYFLYCTTLPEGAVIENNKVKMKVYKAYVPVADPLLKYTLSDELEHKYISSNSASVLVGTALSKLLNKDAKVYENLDMPSLSESYEFNEDVTDGTEQEYQISNTYKTYANLTLASRCKTKEEMSRMGWDIGNASYATVHTITGLYDKNTDSSPSDPNSATTAVVVTPILDGGIIMYDTDAEDCAYKAASEDMEAATSTPWLLAKFTGEGCYKKSEIYCDVLHKIQALYYNYDNEFTEEETAVFKYLSDKRINAVASGLHEDALQDIMLTLDIPFYQKEYVIAVIEQMSTSGCQNKESNYNNQPAICLESDGLRHVRFECNGVLDKEVKFEDLLYKIMLTARSYITRSEDNKISVLIGKPNPYPATVLSQRNCLSRSNTKSLEDVPCGYLSTLVDEDDNYTQNSFYVMMKGEDYRDPSKNIEPFNIEYVTNKFQLHLLTLFNLVCRNYQIENYSRTVGVIGNTVSMGDTVLLQDDSLLVGTDNGGRIVELLEDDDKIYGFTIDDFYEFKPNTGMGCTIIQPGKYGKDRCVTLPLSDREVTVNSCTYKVEEGTTNLCIFDKAVIKDTGFREDGTFTEYDIYSYAIKPDCLVNFGVVTKMNIKAVIVSYKPKGKEQFDLSLVPYNEKLYNAGSGIPVFNSNITNPNNNNDFTFNTLPTVSDLNETANSIAQNSVGYTVKASMENVFFNTDSNGYTIGRQSVEITYNVYKGRLYLEPVEDDPGIGQFRVNIPEEIEGLTIERGSSANVIKITVEDNIYLSTILENGKLMLNIEIDCEGVE